MTHETRTIKQNASLHKFCELLADSLNSAGYEMKAVLAVKQVDVPWSPESIKEVLWRPIMEAATGKESSAKLDTVEIQNVYQILDRHISTNFGVHVEWPSVESMRAEYEARKQA